MGSSIANLLILTVLFAAVLMMFRFSLTSDALMSDAVKESAHLLEQRANSRIELSSVSASEVFRCASKVLVTAGNTGEVAIGDAEKMDFVGWYTPQTGGTVTERFTYTTGNIEEGEWTLFSMTPNDITPLWEPDEAIRLISRLPQPPKAGTSGYVILSTPGGVSAQDYVEFTDGALGDCRFLHNNPSPPSGNTSSQVALPMDTGLPMSETLYNYDEDRDSSPGLKLVRTNQGLSETIPARFQAWRTDSLNSDLIITGDVLINLWGALVPPNSGDTGIVLTYLRDYDGVDSYTEIGEGAVFARDWQSGSSSFVERVVLIPNIGYTVPAGHELEVRLVVDDASNEDMEFAFDTENFPSFVHLSFVPPDPTTSLYLHNLPTPPTGDTPSQAVLLLDATAPAATTLYDYDSPDNNPGLTLKKPRRASARPIPTSSKPGGLAPWLPI